MTEFTLREISPEEYRERLMQERDRDGLYRAVEKRCDIINEECEPLGYTRHGFIQEQLIEILELVEG